MPEDLLIQAATVFMGFFAIMNPIASVPVFISLTIGEDRHTTRAMALRSVVLAFVIVVVFAVMGNVIFQLFGITLPAFRIAGGLLVFRIGFHMLEGSRSSVQHLSASENEGSRIAPLSVAVSPLAMPILAGPGTIATAMSFTAEARPAEVAVTIGAFAALCLITYVLFVSGERLVTFIGPGALGVVTRMMGLILAVVGTQLVIEGAHGAFELVRE